MIEIIHKYINQDRVSESAELEKRAHTILQVEVKPSFLVKISIWTAQPTSGET